MSKTREKSVVGTYHILLRSCDRQSIFKDKEDYGLMISLLQNITKRFNQKNEIVEDELCEVYAYCLLPDHCHFVIREVNDTISSRMKWLQDKFTYHYNVHHKRFGGIFHNRFMSEPIETADRFYELLKYVNMELVSNKLRKKQRNYIYSSWHEYLSWKNSNYSYSSWPQICTFGTTNYPILVQLQRQLMEDPHPNTNSKFMDITDKPIKLSDQEAFNLLLNDQMLTEEEFFKLSLAVKVVYIHEAMEMYGISLRQATRFSKITYYTLRKELKGFDTEKWDLYVSEDDDEIEVEEDDDDFYD